MDALKLSRSTMKQYLNLLNIWSKEVPVNIIYPGTVNQIDSYMYESISTSSVRYIIKSYKQISYKRKKIKRIQGGDFNRLF